MELVQEEGRELLARLAGEHRVRVSCLDEPLFSRDHFEITREWPRS
jgi:hypothetical protein